MKIQKFKSDDEQKDLDFNRKTSVKESVEFNEIHVISSKAINEKLADHNNTVNIDLQSTTEQKLTEYNRNMNEDTYLENCVKKCKEELIRKVIQNFDKEGTTYSLHSIYEYDCKWIVISSKYACALVYGTCSIIFLGKYCSDEI